MVQKINKLIARNADSKDFKLFRPEFRSIQNLSLRSLKLLNRPTHTASLDRFLLEMFND